MLVLALASWGTAQPALAAEQVILRYGIFRAPVSRAELAALAEQGQVSARLQSYLDLSGQSPQQVRSWLNRSVAVEGEWLERGLNTPLGRQLLGELTAAIAPPTAADRSRQIPDPPPGSANTRSNRRALQQALVGAARPDNRITPLEVVTHYPEPEVTIRLDRLQSWVANFQGARDRLGGTVEGWIRQVRHWLPGL